jgi:hypothetical protein
MPAAEPSYGDRPLLKNFVFFVSGSLIRRPVGWRKEYKTIMAAQLCRLRNVIQSH